MYRRQWCNSFVMSLNYNWMDQHKDLGSQRKGPELQHEDRKRVYKETPCGVSVPPGLSSNVDIIQPPLELSLPLLQLWKHSYFFFFLFLLQVASSTKIIVFFFSLQVLFRFTDSATSQWKMQSFFLFILSPSTSLYRVGLPSIVNIPSSI